MSTTITNRVYEERREKVRKHLQENNITALFISDSANRYYLSGFEMGDIHTYSTGGYILICTSGKDILFTDSRYIEAAYKVWDKENVVLYSSPAKDIANFLHKNIQGTIGIEEHSMNVAFYSIMKQNNSLAPADSIVPKIRAIKEDREIALMKESVALNHAVMATIENELHEGITERDLAWYIEQFYKNSGASHLSFSSIVAFGKNGALPHYAPEDENAELFPNMSVLIDCGCVYSAYCSDQTRSFWFGDSPSAEFTKTYELVHEAQRIGMEAIRAGVSCHDVYMASYSFFEKHGVAQYFTHGLGHGIGVAVHEDPRLRKGVTTKLEHNMVVTVEPGLYYPQWGGIRLEYMVRVLEDGYEIL